MYQEIKPSAVLKDVIDSFWTFSSMEVGEIFKVLPDTCADLIFDLNENKGFLSGIMTNYQFVDLPTDSQLIGVRFKTEKFGSLCKIPLNETKNLRVELGEIFPADNLDIIDHLADSGTLVDKLGTLEKFISTSFKRNHQRQDQMVLAVAVRIRLLNGIVSPLDLASTNYISLRQLERRFKRYVGLTIKEFSNIVRFNCARRAISRCTETSLSEIAFDTGFFDHAHMSHDFTRISGENPSHFR